MRNFRIVVFSIIVPKTLVRNRQSFQVAENVDPAKGGDTDVKDPQSRRYDEKVNELHGNPVQAGSLKGLHELYLALVREILSGLHVAHTDEEENE